MLCCLCVYNSSDSVCKPPCDSLHSSTLMLAARAVVRARAVRVAAAGARMVVARGMRSVPALFAEAADTHDDFKPKVKVDVSDKGAVLDHIRKVRGLATPALIAATSEDRSNHIVHQTVETNAVVLYMKGTPQQPMCGFSRQAVMILQAAGSLLARRSAAAGAIIPQICVCVCVCVCGADHCVQEPSTIRSMCSSRRRFARGLRTFPSGQRSHSSLSAANSWVDPISCCRCSTVGRSSLCWMQPSLQPRWRPGRPGLEAIPV